jgi:hypothetical protein
MWGCYTEVSPRLTGHPVLHMERACTARFTLRYPSDYHMLAILPTQLPSRARSSSVGTVATPGKMC